MDFMSFNIKKITAYNHSFLLNLNKQKRGTFKKKIPFFHFYKEKLFKNPFQKI